jgi:hypothetical protein
MMPQIPDRRLTLIRPSLLSRIPLAGARGSEPLILSRDREGAVVNSNTSSQRISPCEPYPLVNMRYQSGALPEWHYLLRSFLRARA